MSVESFVNEIAEGVRREVMCRKALQEIRDKVWDSLEGDRNPNRGDLMRLDRIAAQALKETEVD